MTKYIEKSKLIDLFLAMLLALYCVLVVILSSVPPISRDALTHHLAVPKLYVLKGSIFEIPWLDFSYFPMNLDFLYAIPLYFNNDIIPKYIHFTFGLGTSVLIFYYLKSRISNTFALIGSLFFLTTPVIIKLSTTAYVDLGLIFFTTASLLLLFEWQKQPGRSFFFLIFSAISLGLALGTKPNGLLSLLLISLLFPLYLIYKQNIVSQVRIIKFSLFFIIVALLTYSPWMIRNYIWTNNPIYPFFNSVINQSQIINNEPTISIGYLTLRSLIYNESNFQILLLPFRMFWEGQDNIPRLFDGKLNIFLLFLPCFAFIWQSKTKYNAEIKIMMYFSVLFLSFALFLSPARIRYISPILPFLVILSCFGLNNIFLKMEVVLSSRHLMNFLRFSFLIALFLPSIIYFSYIFNYIKPFEYLNADITRDEYISRYRPEYPTMIFANKSLPVDSNIACFFMGKRGYYLDLPHRFYNPKKYSLPDFLINPIDSTKNSIWLPDYILLNNALFNKWFNSLSLEQHNLFLKKVNQRPLFSQSGYTLLSLNKEDINVVEN